MIYPITDLNSWPLDLVGWPVLKTTNEALLYAQLIYNDTHKQEHLPYYRKELYAQLKCEREKKEPDFDYMMDLAVRAQFYRECLEESQRIRLEKVNTPGGQPNDTD